MWIVCSIQLKSSFLVFKRVTYKISATLCFLIVVWGLQPLRCSKCEIPSHISVTWSRTGGCLVPGTPRLQAFLGDFKQEPFLNFEIHFLTTDQKQKVLPVTWCSGTCCCQGRRDHLPFWSPALPLYWCGILSCVCSSNQSPLHGLACLVA